MFIVDFIKTEWCLFLKISFIFKFVYLHPLVRLLNAGTNRDIESLKKTELFLNVFLCAG